MQKTNGVQSAIQNKRNSVKPRGNTGTGLPQEIMTSSKPPSTLFTSVLNTSPTRNHYIKKQQHDYWNNENASALLKNLVKEKFSISDSVTKAKCQT